MPLKKYGNYDDNTTSKYINILISIRIKKLSNYEKANEEFSEELKNLNDTRELHEEEAEEAPEIF